MMIWLIRLFLNLMRIQLIIKTHIAKLKIIKHQRQDIPTKMIQKAQKQTKLLHFLTLCHKYYQMIKLQKDINSLNSKQREVSNVVHTWARNDVKYDGHSIEPVHIFLSGSGETGKSHLVKVIYNAISKTFLYYCKDPEKPRVLLLGPTEISAVNIGGTTIHSNLVIKLGTKLLGLN